MALLIIGIILLIAGVGTGIAVKVTMDSKGGMVGGIAAGVGLCILLVFLSCVASVPTGHTGVITEFGRVKDGTLDSGFHFKAPWESIVKMDNRVQKETVQLSCFSSDIQEVNVVYTLNFQINKQNASEIYKTIGTDYYTVTIAPTIAESLKVVVAKYTAEELIGARETLAATVETNLADQLTKFNIEVVSTAIEDMDFTDSFTDAVEAKQVADQKAKQSKIEQEQAKMVATYNKRFLKLKLLPLLKLLRFRQKPIWKLLKLVLIVPSIKARRKHLLHYSVWHQSMVGLL